MMGSGTACLGESLPPWRGPGRGAGWMELWASALRSLCTVWERKKEREGGISQWREGGPESEPPDAQRSPGKETQPQDKETWGGWPQLPLAQVEKLWWVLG